jgi:nucleoid-associated protein YgaU
VKNPLQSLIQMGVIPSVAFPTDSRYYNSRTVSYTAPNAQVITYLAQRLLPQPGPANYSNVATHTVRSGDRLDLLAAKYYGDPLMYWLICDANSAIRPNQLVRTPGTVLNITMPHGVSGAATNA